MLRKTMDIIKLTPDKTGWFIDLFDKYKVELNNTPIEALLSFQNGLSNINIIEDKAFIRYSFKEPYFTFIHELCVDEPYQKQGFAKLLINSVLTKETFVAAYPGIAGLYLKLGFKELYTTSDKQFIILCYECSLR